MDEVRRCTECGSDLVTQCTCPEGLADCFARGSVFDPDKSPPDQPWVEHRQEDYTEGYDQPNPRFWHGQFFIPHCGLCTQDAARIAALWQDTGGEG